MRLICLYLLQEQGNGEKNPLLTLALLDTSLHVLTLALELTLALQVSQEVGEGGGCILLVLLKLEPSAELLYFCAYWLAAR